MTGTTTERRSEEFFERLAAVPHPFLHDVSATIRIDIEENGRSRHFHLTVDHGTITVTRRNAPADATMHTDPTLFDQIITGEANVLTAALRGRLRIDGNPRLLVAFKRLLPGPPTRATTVPAPTGSSEPTAGTTNRTDPKEDGR
ncbi:MAG TPA: SCP2 sterol-binding domain-containing protein [Micromonosporaceae bacterium]|jgi:alkyl sulfatase BDS1-like metallo-beta-lactamase superfamily hydrolase